MTPPWPVLFPSSSVYPAWFPALSPWPIIFTGLVDVMACIIDDTRRTRKQPKPPQAARAPKPPSGTIPHAFAWWPVETPEAWREHSVAWAVLRYGSCQRWRHSRSHRGPPQHAAAGTVSKVLARFQHSIVWLFPHFRRGPGSLERAWKEYAYQPRQGWPLGTEDAR